MAGLLDEIDSKFDTLTGNGIDLGPDWLNTIVFGYEPPGDSDWVEKKRQECKTIVKTVLYGASGDTTGVSFDKFRPGMDLPVDLLKKAAEWRAIKEAVITAQAFERETISLGATWTGAGTAYESMRMKEQDPAFIAMIGVAEQIAKELEDISKDVSKYYTELQKTVVALVNAVKEFWGKLFSMDFINAYVNAISDAAKTMTDALGNIVTTLTSVSGANNRLEYLTKAQAGFSSTNQWPRLLVDKTI